MKTALLLALTIALFPSALMADDIETLDGALYTNAKVTRIDPDGITIRWSAGIAKVPFESLSPELRDKYGYEPEKARQHKESLAAIASERRKMVQQQATVNREIKETTSTGWYKVVSIHHDYAIMTEQYYFPDARTGRLVTRDPIMVHGLPRNLVDGSRWEGALFSAGIGRYTTVLGAGKTVKRYATTRNEAASLLMQTDEK